MAELQRRIKLGGETLAPHYFRMTESGKQRRITETGMGIIQTPVFQISCLSQPTMVDLVMVHIDQLGCTNGARFFQVCALIEDITHDKDLCLSETGIRLLEQFEPQSVEEENWEAIVAMSPIPLDGEKYVFHLSCINGHIELDGKSIGADTILSPETQIILMLSQTPHFPTE